MQIKDVECVIVDLSEEDEKELNIRLNANTGEWDMEKLQDWDLDLLNEWGLNVNFKEDKVDGEIVFSNELDSESNYIVLKFSKDIDFLHIESLLGLKSTYSKRQNGKPWAKGIGRVVNGVDAIIKIKES